MFFSFDDQDESRAGPESSEIRTRSRKEGVARSSKREGSGNLESDRLRIICGDALEELKKIPSNSVSLILTDPPYHVTKKANIEGDRSFVSNAEYLTWLEQIGIEWKRILKFNGAFYCFCAPSLASHIEVMFSKTFNILSSIVWTKPNEPGFDGWKQKMKKESLRQWYAHSERVIFAEPSTLGNLKRTAFGVYLRNQRIQAGLSTYELTDAADAYGAVNHGGAVSNWETGRNVPSESQYSKMCKAIIGTGKVSSMLPYREAIRPFAVNANVPFIDVWDFPSVRPYAGKHPAEKPLRMIEHMIAASSYPDDLVLDCFSGSGSTLLAAMRLGRRCISIDIDPKWTDRQKAMSILQENL